MTDAMISPVKIDSVALQGYAGRPMNKRSEEIQRLMKSAMDAGRRSMRIELNQAEQDSFIRFSGKVRGAGRRLGVGVSVRSCQDGRHGEVVFLEGRDNVR